MSVRIHVRNCQRTSSINTRGLTNFAEYALLQCADLERHGNVLPSLPRIDVLLVSDRRISELHRRFMQIKGATDVITFQHGEIFVSVETAARQAAQYRTTLELELKLYIVHGLLHLAGYDDHTKHSAAEMRRKQSRILVHRPHH
jgi:rRNA maturation RNase YbeY